MMRSILPIFIALTVLVGCQTGSSPGYVVEGTVNGTEATTIYLDYLTDQQVMTIDTAALEEDGGFRMDGTTDERGFYRLRTASDNYWLVLMGPDDHIEIEVDVADPNSATLVEAPEASAAFQEVMDFLIAGQDELMALRQEAQQLQMTGGTPEQMQAIQLQYQQADAERRQALKARLESETDPFVKTYLLSALNINQEYEYVKNTAQRLRDEFGENPYLTGILQRVDQVEQQRAAQEAQEELQASLQPGVEVPDIVMKNPQGQDMRLSDLRGQVVLVDFWASWCKPCRVENPNLVKAYEAYHDQGFEIFSVSLDKNRAKWVKAIEDDGLVWPYHVSDLQGWSNAAARTYGVNSIPFALLIDQEGKVVDKNLRGPALEAALEEIL